MGVGSAIGLRAARCLPALLLMLSATGASASEPSFASPWAQEHTARIRLVAGGVPAAGQPARLFAGIEIALDQGWKTYWRNPGSSGVPPRLDWAGSENLAEAVLRFPAPERFADKDGDTIGYKTFVLLPVEIKPMDPARPVVLKLVLELGVCREICIPVQPSLTLTLAPDAVRRPAGQALAAAIDRLPRPPDGRRAGDPQVRSVTVDLASAKPSIVIEAVFPGDSSGADVFLEAPEGLWIPLAKSAGPAAGPLRRFEVDLTDGADIADLKGRVIRVTLVSAAGQCETTFRLE